MAISPAPPGTVRLYVPDHPLLAATVKAMLERRRQRLIDELVLAADWANFCERRGVIFGIDEAIQHAIDAENNLNKRGQG